MEYSNCTGIAAVVADIQLTLPTLVLVCHI